MGNTNFTEDFKRDAVVQITERGYPVAEVAARLGISKYSFSEWRKRYGKSAAVVRDDDHAAEVRRLRRELQRVTEERGILKKAAVGSTNEDNGLIQGISWGPVAKRLSGPSVQAESNRIQLVLVRLDRSMPRGKYRRRRPLVFSLLPRCLGLCGSQK